MAGPLAGIRVLEVANWIAAPAAAAMLADLGADVVKVEPPQGDPYRGASPVALGFHRPLATNWAFQMDNRGKRSIAVALDQPGAPELVQRMAAQCDVFITNLLPERKARYGLTFAQIRAASPRIVYASLSGYGTSGPDAGRPGFDFVAFWAGSGPMSLVGEPDGPPIPARSGQGDHTTSFALLAAILVGLRERDATGQAQEVEATLQSSGMWTVGVDFANALAGGANPPKISRRSPKTPMANCYRCADGAWIQFMMPTPFPDYWPRFCQVVGRPQWAEPAPLGATTFDELVARTREWVVELDTVFPTRTSAEWAARCDAHGVIWSPVAQLTDVAANPQVEAMGWITELEHPQHGRFRTLDTPFRIHGAHVGARGPAPDVGQDTADVLADFGIDEETITALAIDRVFG
jgi:crotonobetainyl-CoA:carnitine CoA-transferase CaiB-like acyl-CoA transferase